MRIINLLFWCAASCASIALASCETPAERGSRQIAAVEAADDAACRGQPGDYNECRRLRVQYWQAAGAAAAGNVQRR